MVSSFDLMILYNQKCIINVYTEEGYKLFLIIIHLDSLEYCALSSLDKCYKTLPLDGSTPIALIEVRNVLMYSIDITFLIMGAVLHV